MMRRLATVVVITIVIAGTAQIAQAQAWQNRHDRGIQPGQRPTLSPYLDLLRVNPGPLPNYYQFVRPKIQLQQQGQRQWQAIRNLQSESRHERSVKQLPATGGGGHFQNYLHFYRMGTGRR